MQSSRKRKSNRISGSDPLAEEEAASRAVRRSPRLEKKQAVAAAAPSAAEVESVAEAVESAAVVNLPNEDVPEVPETVTLNVAQPEVGLSSVADQKSKREEVGGVEVPAAGVEAPAVEGGKGGVEAPAAGVEAPAVGGVEAPAAGVEAPAVGEGGVQVPAEGDVEASVAVGPAGDEVSELRGETSSSLLPPAESAEATPASLFTAGNLARFPSLFGGEGAGALSTSTPFGLAQVEDVETQGDDALGEGLSKADNALPGLFPGEEDEELVDSRVNCELLKAQKVKSARSDGDSEILKFCSVGSGMARLLKDKNDASKGRVVFRVSGTWNVLLNSPWEFVNRMEKVDNQRGNSLRFTAYDYCQSLLTPGVKVSAFVIHFAKKDDRDNFADALASKSSMKQ